MGDGAEWILNLADFPSAVQIVDLYHAHQHLWEVAHKLHPDDEAQQTTWMKAADSGPEAIAATGKDCGQ